MEEAILAAYYTVIVAVIGALASIVTVALTKRHEQKIELRKIKEKQYIDFLTFLTKTKLATDLSKTKSVFDNGNSENEKRGFEAELSVRIQTIYLVGNKKVQQSLKNFLDMFFGAANKTQSQLYGELLLEMKKDLYGRRLRLNSWISLREVGFTIFVDK